MGGWMLEFFSFAARLRPRYFLNSRTGIRNEIQEIRMHARRRRRKHQTFALARLGQVGTFFLRQLYLGCGCSCSLYVRGVAVDMAGRGSAAGGGGGGAQHLTQLQRCDVNPPTVSFSFTVIQYDYTVHGIQHSISTATLQLIYVVTNLCKQREKI